jgi:hypothetical protein
MPPKITRRSFSALVVGSVCDCAWAQAPVVAGRELDFRIQGDFGGASEADIKAVLHSAADSIWTHCPSTRWEAPGFFIFNNKNSPITLYDHRPDGRIAIGLNSQGHHWAQLAFQFAHEFCHALAGHSNDWRKPKIRGRSANLWLEESLCETASLFALQSMGKTWQTKPPYENWKSYANSLTSYADDRVKNSAKYLPKGTTFVQWFRESENAMRDNAVLREKNDVVARHLLPLFEAQPSGWEALTFLNLGERDPKRSLEVHLRVWKSNVPSELVAFVEKIGERLGVRSEE